jgi:hypothetical protein
MKRARRRGGLADLLNPLKRNCRYQVRLFGDRNTKLQLVPDFYKAKSLASRATNASVVLVCPGQPMQTLLKCHRGKCLSDFEANLVATRPERWRRYFQG